jgi:hypothetical protein
LNHLMIEGRPSEIRPGTTNCSNDARDNVGAAICDGEFSRAASCCRYRSRCTTEPDRPLCFPLAGGTLTGHVRRSLTYARSLSVARRLPPVDWYVGVPVAKDQFDAPFVSGWSLVVGVSSKKAWNFRRGHTFGVKSALFFRRRHEASS